MDVDLPCRKCLGLEGISRAERASGFLQSEHSSFDVSAGKLERPLLGESGQPIAIKSDGGFRT